MFLQICVLTRSKSKKQSFLAAITSFNDQPLSFNRWFTRSVVVYVDLKVAWNGWVSKNTRRAAICWELWMRHWLSWAFSGLRFSTDYGTDCLQLSRIQTWVVVDTLYVFMTENLRYVCWRYLIVVSFLRDHSFPSGMVCDILFVCQIRFYGRCLDYCVQFVNYNGCSYELSLCLVSFLDIVYG